MSLNPYCINQNLEPYIIPSPYPAVAYVTNIATATTIPNGGSDIPIGTTIATGNTTVPSGTVTLINGYTGIPTTNVGGVLSNNGFFTVPVRGEYIIITNISFASVTTVTSSDFRQVYIYKVAVSTGLVTQLATDDRIPISGSPTSINVSTNADLNAGDRIFVAVRQLNSTSATVDTVAGVNRFEMVKIA